MATELGFSPESSMFSEMVENNASRVNDSHSGLYEEILMDDFDPALLTPVFFGRFPRRINDTLDTDAVHLSSDSQTHINFMKSGEKSEGMNSLLEYDPAVVHPATFGYVLLDKKPVVQKEEKHIKPLPDPKECSPREYLEAYIFPILLPALENMFTEAKKNKVFEKRRTKFNACDFLTWYLYREKAASYRSQNTFSASFWLTRHNPNYQDRGGLQLEEIPFVQEILAVNPRPPIPLSLLLSDDEAAVIIQSYYRGYQVRKDPEVQELREYQREMREEEVNINFRVEDFWRKYSLQQVE